MELSDLDDPKFRQRAYGDIEVTPATGEEKIWALGRLFGDLIQIARANGVDWHEIRSIERQVLRDLFQRECALYQQADIGVTFGEPIVRKTKYTSSPMERARVQQRLIESENRRIAMMKEEERNP